MAVFKKRVTTFQNSVTFWYLNLYINSPDDWSCVAELKASIAHTVLPFSSAIQSHAHKGSEKRNQLWKKQALPSYSHNVLCGWTRPLPHNRRVLCFCHAALLAWPVLADTNTDGWRRYICTQIASASRLKKPDALYTSSLAACVEPGIWRNVTCLIYASSKDLGFVTRLPPCPISDWCRDQLRNSAFFLTTLKMTPLNAVEG